MSSEGLAVARTSSVCGGKASGMRGTGASVPRGALPKVCVENAPKSVDLSCPMPACVFGR